MTTQQIAFNKAYSLLFLGKQAKLYRTEDGEWICEEIGEVK